MKNHITPHWKALPATALLWHTLPAHGQVVTVPLACHVMVPGVGGTTGPGGDVGHGGIVMMRDPYAGGNFTFIGATGPQWTLLGDLSFPTLGTPPAPPVQGLATGLTQNIRSYNKILRQSEENTPSTNARSKGRVTIEYTLEECDQVMTFDIYKRWGDPAVDYYNFRYAPPIVGPDCWADGLITFSVDQVSSDNALDAIGFDQYYWMFTNMADDVLPSGAFYTSADRSSVTINQDSFDNPPFATWLGVGGPYTIQVCFGRANPWDGGTADDLVQATTGHTCVTKTIHAAPVEPVFTPPIPDCVSTGATAFPATITYDPVAGYTYDWACTNSSWTLTPGTGTLAVSTMDGNPGTLILTMTGPCGTQAYQYPVGRTYTSDQLVASETCVDAGGTVTITTGDSPLVPTCWTASPA
ncbi:MAG: hypothetical protein RBT71_13215, partial [Flavobacteriales bacterium]|nr:hypothetical protein [Flavobacteriales bacterium]